MAVARPWITYLPTGWLPALHLFLSREGSGGHGQRLRTGLVTNAQTPGSSPSNPLACAPDAGFDAFFQRFQHDIFTYLCRITGDEQAAYDLSQETFLRAWQHFAKISAYDRPRAWLFRIATNLALNHHRGRSARAAFSSLDTRIGHPASSDPAWRLAERDHVRQTLLDLSPRHRAGLVLREVYGLTCEEVAHALGTSPAAAKMLLCRAREQFRERYRREEVRP
jgi:RNA polymerase sigma-70 factor (ECF subfamily)